MNKEKKIQFRLNPAEEVELREMTIFFGRSKKISQLIRISLRVFKWILDEKAQGRIIVSTDKEGNKTKELVF